MSLEMGDLALLTKEPLLFCCFLLLLANYYAISRHKIDILETLYKDYFIGDNSFYRSAYFDLSGALDHETRSFLLKIFCGSPGMEIFYGGWK